MNTIDNTMTSEEVNMELPLFAETPSYMNIRHTYYTLKQAGKGVLAVASAVASAFAVAYAGKKVRDHYKNNAHNIPVEDPNKDIIWDINQ